MFYLNKDIPLTEILLSKIQNRFCYEVRPKLVKNKDYYDGVQKILTKTYTDETKTCSRIITNYCKNIVDSYGGYIASPGYIAYKSEQDIEDILDILRYNDFQAEDSEFLHLALIYGTAAELMYIDSDSHIRFKLIDPRQCFGIYDDALGGDLLYFVRFYKASEWDDSNLYYLDVYTDTEIRHYQMFSECGTPKLISSEPHYFNQCPANIFYLQDEKSIFDCILSLQDAVNEILSDEVDDYAAFCDAYLALTGVDADAEDIEMMKENRVLLLPDGALANWLTKNASDAQVENILQRLHNSIYRIAQCPDFSSESFVGGVSSGVAIRYRLTGMENKAAQIVALMKKALQRRIELICGFASILEGEEVFRDIDIVFTRNIASDNTDIVNLVRGLQGIVSDETLLAMLPQITDVSAEMERIKEQKADNLAMYSFGE
ncbi:MAG: phage portal protein [Prevotellaceae bacterium]|nr:phage portal protein [Candidatus Faecinaster equi]